MATVYIGIGTNLGDRQKNCLRAVELIKQSRLSVTKQSSVHETAPWGVTDQPAYLNMAVEIETGLEPAELLSLLKKIEKDMGRQETMKWGPRLIDLDILIYDDAILHTDTLTIPHPLMHEREFVLEPLAELAEDLVHPVLKRKIGDLLREKKLKRMD
jgi:2-amino-4-hydroxy-6-hydroxymethyldihydropteridine diphosphokinase